MSKLIILLITEFLEGMLDSSGSSLLNITSMALYPEKEMANMGFTGFEDVTEIFLWFGISMIVLKFLKKGFDIYILGTDGDPDSEPVVLLTNFFRAMAIALCFPEIYDWSAKVINSLTEKTLNAIGVATVNIDLTNFIMDFLKGGLFLSIFILVYAIIYLKFYLKFIKIGLQILILRTGIPISCMGLMDSNEGVFKPYIQKFLQVGLTVLIQVVLAKFSFAFVLSGHLLWGFATLMFAIKTPRFLQEFLILPEGGNGMNTVHSGARIAQALKSVVR